MSLEPPPSAGADRAPFPSVHFGGPGSPPGALRDLLAARIRASARGDRIDFVTYYFRDRRLAADLAAAAERGVDVRVSLEARPRRKDANEAVVARLAQPIGSGGIGGGLRCIDHAPLFPGTKLRARLHEKLYVFSNPPAALIGSFNPSGDEPELSPEAIREIGDHDRGYNLLVEFRNAAFVAKLAEHARRIHAHDHGALERFGLNAGVADDGCELFYLPRTSSHPFFAKLGALRAGDCARIVASHVSGMAASRALAAAVARGARVELLSHANARRFPAATEAELTKSGVRVQRVGSETAHPMHDKFALLECAGERIAAFGSFNLNPQSRWLNHEIGVLSRDAAVYAALDERWTELRRSGTAQ